MIGLKSFVFPSCWLCSSWLLGMEVFSRFLLGKSFSWMEELCRYLFVWSSYIGVAIAVKHKEQLRILMFMDVLKKRFPQLVRILYVVSELTFTVFCALVFYYSLGMLENMIRFQAGFRRPRDQRHVRVSHHSDQHGPHHLSDASGLCRDIRNNTLEFESRED